MKIEDMLCAETGVLLEEGRGVGGQHRTELLEEEERDRTTPIVAFDLRFLDTRKRSHVSNSDLSRQQVRSNGSDLL